MTKLELKKETSLENGVWFYIEINGERTNWSRSEDKAKEIFKSLKEQVNSGNSSPITETIETFEIA